MSNLVQGFDYTTGKAVAYTPKEWRAKYADAQRLTSGGQGETWYKTPAHAGRFGREPGKLLAEAYAIIPQG